MEALQALKQEIDEMVITSPEKARLAQQIICCVDHLQGLLDNFSNE